MDKNSTWFAPAERAPEDRFEADRALVASQATLMDFLHAVSSLVLVLNPERQVLYVSGELADWRTLAGEPLGNRLGQLFGCLHAEEDNGCGTTESCALCGATRAIVESQRLRQRVVQECRLTVRDPQGAVLDLEVTSTPWTLEGRPFTVLTLRDIASEKRRQSLEKIFFHDIVNAVGGLAGLLDVLTDFPDLNDGKDLVGLSQRSSQDVLEEILLFRQLKLAEKGELVPEFELWPVTRLLDEVAGKIRFHSVAAEKQLVVEPGPEGVVRTDRLLLERIVVNMVKNALEASQRGQQVRLSARHDGAWTFSVCNQGEMPRDVQLQVFQRSFSTKGADRGLGTYSMRLLGERYLGGKVAFTSADGATEFTVTLP